MINIKYGNYYQGVTGEANIDIITFIRNRTQADVTFLCKKIINKSYDRDNLSTNIIKICSNEIVNEKAELHAMVNVGNFPMAVLRDKTNLIKRYQKCIELLKG